MLLWKCNCSWVLSRLRNKSYKFHRSSRIMLKMPWLCFCGHIGCINQLRQNRRLFRISVSAVGVEGVGWWRGLDLAIVIIIRHAFQLSRQSFNSKFIRSKGYSSRKLINEFPQKRWKRRGLDELLKKIRETGSVDRRDGMEVVDLARRAPRITSMQSKTSL